MRPSLRGPGLAVLMFVGAVSTATAGERFVDLGGYSYDGGYGFAREAIGGDYIGAPLTRFPRPSEIVPPAWGYGTYGVPTVAGIRQAPTAAPTLTVVNGQEALPRRRGQRNLSRGSEGYWATNPYASEAGQTGIRVISVTVPRR